MAATLTFSIFNYDACMFSGVAVFRLLVMFDFSPPTVQKINEITPYVDWYLSLGME